QGWADPERLYVTGGSGGGILTAWIVTQTNRFRAAVSAKPVINWYSFVLTSDNYNFYYRYWFPDLPWRATDHYLSRSPLHFIDQVSTPTMLLSVERDYRTPISEAEQFYQALKLKKIATALVRVPDASHSIAARPSHLIAKTAHILAWFSRYDNAQTSAEAEPD
ncbi:MAG: prolyl oligopeptidase family serine peptidase, partial [Gammaproteobacteria bacterium]|nr:prolyl oligopeptidase family serine peptidase [Gammaproteobacteria bacterium]